MQSHTSFDVAIVFFVGFVTAVVGVRLFQRCYRPIQGMATRQKSEARFMLLDALGLLLGLVAVSVLAIIILHALKLHPLRSNAPAYFLGIFFAITIPRLVAWCKMCLLRRRRQATFNAGISNEIDERLRERNKR